MISPKLTVYDGDVLQTALLLGFKSRRLKQAGTALGVRLFVRGRVALIGAGGHTGSSWRSEATGVIELVDLI